MRFRRGISILIISAVLLSTVGCSKSVSSSSSSTNPTSSSTSHKEEKKIMLLILNWQIFTQMKHMNLRQCINLKN